MEHRRDDGVFIVFFADDPVRAGFLGATKNRPILPSQATRRNKARAVKGCVVSCKRPAGRQTFVTEWNDQALGVLILQATGGL